jgi:hypothetical protein
LDRRSFGLRHQQRSESQAKVFDLLAFPSPIAIGSSPRALFARSGDEFVTPSALSRCVMEARH